MRNKSNVVKKGQKVERRSEEREVNKGDSGDLAKIIPYKESSGYRRNTYV